MKPLIKVFNFILVTFVVVSCQKNDDESRPYEFGFTIDGQQHRHEKKDVNGIIQGEFGFITADGIYHVTVYATDENGNFKILSMRNVRISAPLDGSPLPPGAKIESNPANANQIPTQGQPQAQQQPQTQAQQQPQVPAQGQPQTQGQMLPQIQPIQTTSRPRTTYAFTTQPTIKPACGGCGYVTTPKPIPGQPFPFQTPAFQKPSQQSGVSGASSDTGINPGQTGPTYPAQNTGTNYPAQTPAQNTGTNYPAQTGTNYPAQNTGTNSPAQNAGTNFPPQNTGTSSPAQNPGPNYPGQTGSNYPTQGGSNSLPDLQNRNSGSSLPAPTSGNISPNEIDVNRPRKPLSQVSVSEGAIHVPGNPDIPIRDKFPGMEDGLPNGVTEKDVTDLLYKFNYTVGFHGHYEKGLKNGAKVGGYFVTGRDGISRIVTYVADENGFRPKVKFVRLDLNSDEVPKEGTEKTFGLKNFEFVWYPIS